MPPRQAEARTPHEIAQDMLGKLEEIKAVLDEAADQGLKIEWALLQDPQTSHWSIGRFDVWSKMKLGN